VEGQRRKAAEDDWWGVRGTSAVGCRGLVLGAAQEVDSRKKMYWNMMGCCTRRPKALSPGGGAAGSGLESLSMRAQVR